MILTSQLQPIEVKHKVIKKAQVKIFFVFLFLPALGVSQTMYVEDFLTQYTHVVSEENQKLGAFFFGVAHDTAIIVWVDLARG